MKRRKIVIMRKINKPILYNVIIFILVLIFFTNVCPVIPFDGDDWYFSGAMREPIPIWKGFNPIKVLPEILEPLGGYIGAYIIYPFTHDYVGAISFTQSFIISLFVTALFYSFYKYVCGKFNKNEIEGLIYEAIFALTFFLLFKTKGRNSYYGFWALDLNCYFNYIIPGIINACIVLLMDRYDNFAKIFKAWGYVKKGIFIAAIYFAIFSSIQASIILSMYCIWKIIELIIYLLKNKSKINLKMLAKHTGIYFVELIIWIVSLIFEVNGNRAAQLSTESWLTFENIKSVLNSFKLLYKDINKVLIVFLVINIVIIFVNIIFYSKNKKEKKWKNLKIVGQNAIWVIVSFIYLFLLYLKAGKNYAMRVDATWALVFYIVLFINNCIIIKFELIPKLKIVFPLIFSLAIISTISMNYRFEQSIFNYSIAKQIDNVIINQIIEADRQGKMYIEVKVPKYKENQTNWPQPYNMAIWLQNTLYAHSIINNRLKIVFIPSNELYEEFYKRDKGTEEKYFDLERGKYVN